MSSPSTFAQPELPRRPRRRWLAILLSASLLLNVALLGVGTTFVAKKGGMLYVKQALGLKKHDVPLRPFQLQQAETYRALPLNANDTVFLGDSLTAAAPFADVFSDVKNRGIGGDTTAGILTRLDDVLVGKPDRIFLMIGANDIANEIPTSEIIDNYRTIVRRVKQSSPATRLFVESVLPVNEAMLQSVPPRNPSVRELNPLLRQLAEEEGVTFIELTAAMSDPAGELPNTFTVDGLHLSLKGQLALMEALRPHVSSPKPGK